MLLFPVVADGFDRAAFHGFLALRLFLGRFGLLVNVGMSAILVPFEISRCSFAAEIAIDALVIDIYFARCVF